MRDSPGNLPPLIDLQDERYDGDPDSVCPPSIRTPLPHLNVHRLKDVSDPKKVAPNGQTIEGRMQELCAGVAKDITRCANTCDTYLK